MPQRRVPFTLVLDVTTANGATGSDTKTDLIDTQFEVRRVRASCVLVNALGNAIAGTPLSGRQTASTPAANAIPPAQSVTAALNINQRDLQSAAMPLPMLAPVDPDQDDSLLSPFTINPKQPVRFDVTGNASGQTVRTRLFLIGEKVYNDG